MFFGIRFDIARKDRERAGAMIGNIQGATARWVAEVPETRRTIQRFRQRVLDDSGLEEIRAAYGLDWVMDF